MTNNLKAQRRIKAQAQALTGMVLPSKPARPQTYEEWRAEQVRKGSKLDRLFGSVHPSMR
jgi:hypothetical protein